MATDSAIAQTPMARRNDEAVRVDTEVARQARIVAAAKGLTIGQYLSDALRPVVARDYRELAEQMSHEISPPKEKPSKR